MELTDRLHRIFSLGNVPARMAELSKKLGARASSVFQVFQKSRALKTSIWVLACLALGWVAHEESARKGQEAWLAAHPPSKEWAETEITHLGFHEIKDARAL